MWMGQPMLETRISGPCLVGARGAQHLQLLQWKFYYSLWMELWQGLSCNG